ncbi:MAG: saccharopine dehydrogenase C-terminal domain-containing protein [Chryseolinea sp.]
MNKILVLGAGRSASSLIDYLLGQGRIFGWSITIGDYNLAAVTERVVEARYGAAIQFDINDNVSSARSISKADVVISLLPPHFHIQVAAICLEFRKHLLNASYVSDEMALLHEEAKANDLLFLNECGLDPGIDHMSAMQVIDRVHAEGGDFISFESFTGGLIAPETDPGNPWRYKFTWNPRNVVMAGQSTAKFLQDGHHRYIPYQQLFQRITPVDVDGVWYEGYANRDSLKYRSTYGLDGIQTMLRGTLRNRGFCSAWNILVQLGCCDDTYQMENVTPMTHRSFLNSFVESGGGLSTEESIMTKFGLIHDSDSMKRLVWSGFFNDESVGLDSGSPAAILEHILKKKWTLGYDDKDFIVMWHRFVYEKNGDRFEIQSRMTATGHNQTDTAMARTVGLPLAIAACLLMQGKIKSRGVVIPTVPEIYNPILETLQMLGIKLDEREAVRLSF